MRNVVVASVNRDRVADPACQRIEITSTTDGTYADFVGLDPGLRRQRRQIQHVGYDLNLRPAIVGVFTDLSGACAARSSMSAVIDTRLHDPRR